MSDTKETSDSNRLLLRGTQYDCGKCNVDCWLHSSETKPKHGLCNFCARDTPDDAQAYAAKWKALAKKLFIEKIEAKEEPMEHVAPDCIWCDNEESTHCGRCNGTGKEA